MSPTERFNISMVVVMLLLAGSSVTKWAIGGEGGLGLGSRPETGLLYRHPRSADAEIPDSVCLRGVTARHPLLRSEDFNIATSGTPHIDRSSVVGRYGLPYPWGSPVVRCY